MFCFLFVRFDLSKDSGIQKKRSIIANMMGENKAGNGIFAVSSIKASKPPSSAQQFDFIIPTLGGTVPYKSLMLHFFLFKALLPCVEWQLSFGRTPVCFLTRSASAASVSMRSFDHWKLQGMLSAPPNVLLALLSWGTFTKSWSP